MIVRETGVRGLPQASVAVQVSIMNPEQTGMGLNVDGFDVPVIRHAPLAPLE